MEEPQTEEQVTDIWMKRGELRPTWKLLSYFTMFSFLFLGQFMITDIVRLDLPWRIRNPLFLLIAAVLPAVLLLRTADRRPVLGSLGLRWTPASLRQLLKGFGLAAAMMGLLLVLELLFGGARMFLGRFPPAYLINLLIFGLVSFTIVGFAEEILMRGYPFDVLLRQNGLWTALLLTSVLFSLMHVANPDIGWMALGNILLAGIWLGTARIVSASLWLPIGLHISWNFFLGTVIGFPVSGIEERSLLITEPSGPSIITGGGFGPEGGLLATAVLLIGTGVLLIPSIRSWLAASPAALSNDPDHEETP